MGHRDDLLEGAKRCLLEKGWARTTTRDIVAASGANLASIGYHYGSKDALMMAAFRAVLEDWGVFVSRVLETKTDPGATAMDRFAAVWDAMIEGVLDKRQLWLAQLEIMGQLEHNPEVREAFIEAQPAGWENMVAIFEEVDDREVDPETAKTVGSFYGTLFIGMWVQALLDPSTTPTGRDLAEAMRRIVAGTVLPLRSGTEG